MYACQKCDFVTHDKVVIKDHSAVLGHLSWMAFCSFDMGLLTDCGDDAAGYRDGFPLCSKHLSFHDSMVKAEAELAKLEE